MSLDHIQSLRTGIHGSEMRHLEYNDIKYEIEIQLHFKNS